MEIKKKIVVPTGEIYTAIGEKGMLEFLTVGDYGKNANIKADFLGITRDLNGEMCIRDSTNDYEGDETSQREILTDNYANKQLIDAEDVSFESVSSEQQAETIDPGY